MRACAQVGELTVAVDGNLLTLGDAIQQINLELGGNGARATSTQLTALSHLHGLLAGDGSALKSLVFLDDFLHLSLNLFKLGCRDVVVKFNIIVEAIFHSGATSKLGLGPNAADSGGQHVRAGVTQALQIAGLISLF